MKTLLLDYDGVVLKSKNLMEYQLRKSAKFVNKHTKMPYNICKDMNKQYYPKYGHTVTMLNKMFDIPVTLKDYNDYVFDFNTIKKLKGLVDLTTYEHGHSFKNVFDYCQANDISWYIYTNAHINWVIYFSYLLDIDIPLDKIIWPLNLSLLKPNQESYDTIEKELLNSNFIMVDDSMNNLVIPQSRPSKWTPIHFNEHHTAKKLVMELASIRGHSCRH